jgi:YVTN family beta-propeller protein
VHPDDTYVYATDTSSNSLFVVETAGVTLAKTLSFNSTYISDVAVHPCGDFAYVTEWQYEEPFFGDGWITRIETAGHTKVAGLGFGEFNGWGSGRVEALAISPAGDRLYAALPFIGEISVIDTATFRQVDTISLSSVSDLIFRMAVSAAGDRLYALGGLGVSVFSLPSGAFVTTVLLTGGGALTIHPNGASVLISRESSHELAVMDTATNTLSGAIPVYCPLGMDIMDGTR